MTDKSNSRTDALLTGAPLQTLLLFALPSILGNVFQQLYNIVDAMVAGRFWATCRCPVSASPPR